ncbi:hypothetical protein ACFLU6_02590 [Acidobacteriota bacterium]
MRKTLSYIVVAVFGALLALSLSCSSLNDLTSNDSPGLTSNSDPGSAVASVAKKGGSKGNDVPSGSHYNLNIIGVPKDKSASMTGNNGHRIFVDLWSITKILLREGGSFKVLDANGTDGSATFQLPDPDPDDDLVLAYSVYARALGKPGGSAKMTSCLTDDLGDTYCSTDNVVMIRGKGKSRFQNVSKELLTIYVDIDSDGDLDRMALFDEDLWEYYWEYDNSGLKLAQLRFYPIPFDAN